MKRPYAYGTQTQIETSVAEMRKLLQSAGAVRFGTEEAPDRYAIMAEIGGRWYRFEVTIPNWREFRQIKEAEWAPAYQREADDAKARKRAGQEHRRRWRVLVYLLKAKIVATMEGIETDEEDGQVSEEFAREMLPYLMLPDNSTIGDRHAEVVRALQLGENIRLLPADTGR